MSDHPIRDAVMYGIGCLILLSLWALITWDLIQSLRRDGRTLSNRALEFWKANQGKTALWLALGALFGFGSGFPLGFVLGHLFWPQTP